MGRVRISSIEEIREGHVMYAPHYYQAVDNGLVAASLAALI